MQPLVDALLAGPYPPFGSVPLTAALSFAGRWEEAGVDAARLREKDRDLTSGDPRTLLAAATLAFTDDPDGYRNRDVADRVAQRIRDQQAKGTRFRGQPPEQPARPATDRAAAEGIYERLAEARRRGDSTGVE